MSLTSIIEKRGDIREGLRARTARPSVEFGPIKAPPLTTNYGTVGTAFDYLLRFHLQRINGVAQSTRWVAEAGVDEIDATEHVYDVDDDRLLSKVDRQRRKADKYISEAKAEHRAYLKSGSVSDGLLAATLRLAHLDVAYRAGPDYIDWVALKSPNPQDIADLRALLALVDESAFKAKHVCLLNPTFGRASEMVGGADADLVLDDVLIDIKTTKAPRLDPRHFYQLVGYYLLYGFDGVQCTNSKVVQHEINFLGIYFSRYGHLWTIPVTEVLSPGSVGETAKWFFESVCGQKAQRRTFTKAFRGPFAKFLPPIEKVAQKRSKRRPATKPRKKLMSNRRSHSDARKSGARG